MNRLWPALGLFGLLLASNSHASVVFVTDQTTYNALTAGSPQLVEDFEEASDNVTNNLNFLGPLDQFTNNGVFSTGEIQPGLGIVASGNPTLTILDDGAAGSTSVIVGARARESTLNLVFFNNDVGTVAFDVFNITSNDPIDIVVFGPPNVFLARTTVSGTGTGGTFVGIVSDRIIRRVLIAARNRNIELVDNISFGAPVPEPTSLAVFGLVTLAGGVYYRRRKQAVAA